MTNKYTKNKKYDISIEKGFATSRFVAKKTPRAFSRFIEGSCPSAQNSKKKSEYMKNVYGLLKNHLIDYPSGVDLESNIIISTSEECTYDLDNMVKTIHDSFEGIVFINDKQIKKVTAKLNEYCMLDGVQITIKPLK